MCNPAALAGAQAGQQAVSGVLGFMGQGQAYKANERAANLAYANTENQIGERNVQIDQQQSANSVQAAIDRITAQGRVSASASSMGTDAATSTREANAADFSVGHALGIEDINSTNQRIASGQDSTNAFYQRQSQINSVAKPSALGLALSLAGSAAGGASTFSKLGGQFGGTSPDSGGLNLDALAAGA